MYTKYTKKAKQKRDSHNENSLNSKTPLQKGQPTIKGKSYYCIRTDFFVPNLLKRINSINWQQVRNWLNWKCFYIIQDSQITWTMPRNQVIQKRNLIEMVSTVFLFLIKQVMFNTHIQQSLQSRTNDQAYCIHQFIKQQTQNAPDLCLIATKIKIFIYSPHARELSRFGQTPCQIYIAYYS